MYCVEWICTHKHFVNCFLNKYGTVDVVVPVGYCCYSNSIVVVVMLSGEEFLFHDHVTSPGKTIGPNLESISTSIREVK